MEAVGNLDDILQVSGADVLHVAASDLGQSMGNPEVAEVRRVMSEVIPRVRAGGKGCGVGGNNPSDTAGVAEFVEAGSQLRNGLRVGPAPHRRRGFSEEGQRRAVEAISNPGVAFSTASLPYLFTPTLTLPLALHHKCPKTETFDAGCGLLMQPPVRGRCRGRSPPPFFILAPRERQMLAGLFAFPRF